MNVIGRKLACVMATTLVVCLACGCGERTAGKKSNDPASMEGLGATIGSLARLMSPDAIKVEGYGLVSGLKGTGSSECPPRIRAYLGRYIRRQLPSGGTLDVEKYLNRTDTAVVFVEGVMPAVGSESQYFDVLVTALPGTQTTSLEGGWLFETELKIAGSFGVTTPILADVKGPIFTDKISNVRANDRIGHIMAGGKALREHKIVVVLGRPDFATSSVIRDRLNGRFGANAARAVESDRIELTVPAKYIGRSQRFAAIVSATYLSQDPAIDEKRIAAFVERLAGLQDKYASEIALEAIGNKSLDKLSVLLTSSDERVRFHAARCMLNLRSDAGLPALREIALDKNSTLRIEALLAITAAAAHNDAVAISRLLLRDGNFSIRLAAYEQLRKLDDIAVLQEQVAGNFYLERIPQTDKKVIYVTRTGQPRVVLFGAPITCRGNIFLGSSEGDITINALSGAEYVTIIRRHPKRPEVITRLKSSFEVGDIVRALCDEPPKNDEPQRGGLGVSYADAIVLLKEMCDKGAVAAEFRAGPMPNFGLNIKK
ncbi:MAG: flagellar basal body P-ring protein FlgI [Planctomycetota bacterium]|nr:flagellar basal body P-ring protein FlgI [Planctomycetota bacterium]